MMRLNRGSTRALGWPAAPGTPTIGHLSSRLRRHWGEESYFGWGRRARPYATSTNLRWMLERIPSGKRWINNSKSDVAHWLHPEPVTTEGAACCFWLFSLQVINVAPIIIRQIPVQRAAEICS